MIVFIPANTCLSYNFGEDSGLDKTGQESGYDVGANPETGLVVKIISVIQAILSLIGIIFLLLMMYGGYIWLTAQGNDQQVEKAKNIIVSAIIGLIVVLAAYAISWFFINTFGSQALKKS